MASKILGFKSTPPLMPPFTFGFSPSQLPVLGKRGCVGFVANVKKYNSQPPLFPAEFQRNPEAYERNVLNRRVHDHFMKVIANLF